MKTISKHQPVRHQHSALNTLENCINFLFVILTHFDFSLFFIIFLHYAENCHRNRKRRKWREKKRKNEWKSNQNNNRTIKFQMIILLFNTLRFRVCASIYWHVVGENRTLLSQCTLCVFWMYVWGIILIRVLKWYDLNCWRAIELCIGFMHIFR